MADATAPPGFLRLHFVASGSGEVLKEAHITPDKLEVIQLSPETYLTAVWQTPAAPAPVWCGERRHPLAARCMLPPAHPPQFHVTIHADTGGPCLYVWTGPEEDWYHGH